MRASFTVIPPLGWEFARNVVLCVTRATVLGLVII
jgi:hypothetical protein